MQRMKLKEFRPVARAYGLSIAAWCGLSLLTGVQYRVFDKEMNMHTTFFDMLLLAESQGFAFALLTPPIFYLARRYIGGARDRFRYLLFYCLGAGPFMLLYACIGWCVLRSDPALQEYIPRNGLGPLELIHQGFADQIMMYIAIVVAAHAYQYFEKLRKQEMENVEFQRALAASELQALKMQLHPHFLFNTLHGISTLIDTDQASAKEMVVKLSSLLRGTLEHSSSDLIPLSEELKFVREYLELEAMRLGTRLNVEWSINSDTGSTLVPRLILQPLVENAVRHGIACSRDGGWVEITSTKSAGTLELCIRNSIGGKRTPGLGVGLRNTDARLRYLYADEATFAFAETDDHTATARLRLPALGGDPVGMEREEGTHARADRG
jgi:two-component system LytT family sensor kinase